MTEEKYIIGTAPDTKNIIVDYAVNPIYEKPKATPLFDITAVEKKLDRIIELLERKVRGEL